jgi:hypothetical protein
MEKVLMKPPILIMALLLALTSVSAQKLAKIEPCRVTPEKMPKIRGLYLGMPFADVKAMFKNLYTKPPEENGLRVALIKDILAPEFSDVKEITFVFFDDEVCKIELTYKIGGTNFSSIEGYAGKLSESLTIPKGSWMYRVTENGALAEAKCYGFDATGILTGSASDQMLNLKIESIYIVPTMILREYEADKRKREKTNNFKP